MNTHGLFALLCRLYGGGMEITMKKLLAMLLCAQMLLCGTYAPVHAEESYTDAAAMTDEDFFGVWDKDGEKWLAGRSGKLDYESFPALGDVLAYVRDGNYADAKSELLNYMKTRDTLFDMHNYSERYQTAELLSDGILFFSGAGVGGTFTVGGEWEDCEIDLSGVVSGRGTYSLTLIQRYKAESAAQICSRESEYPPTLVYYVHGKRYETEATADAYIDAGSPEESFGTGEYLYCRESTGDEAYPAAIGSDTRRAVLKFRISGLSADEKVEAAQLKIRARSTGEQTSLAVFKSSQNIWTEDSLCWSNSQQEVISYNGSDCDFVSVPDGTAGFASGLSNNFARFSWATTMSGCYRSSKNELYARALVSLLNAFVESTRENVGAYTSQDAAMRLNLFVNVFHDLLDSDALDANSATAFIKNMWQLSEFLTYTANYRADHNHGCFHTRGLMKSVIYFPEFRKNGEWKALMLKRWGELARNLMANDDYKEGTTAYAATVLNIFNNTIISADTYGFELGEDFYEYTRKLAEYIANASFPNGIDIQLGDSDAVYNFGIVAETARLLDDDRLRYLAKNGEDGVHPGYTSRYFAGSNRLAFMRSGWSSDDLMLAINAAAADARSHTHPDNMSIAMYAYGQRLIVDPGRNNYNDNEISNWLRLTAEAHNTVTIDGKSQGLVAGDVPIFKTNDYFDTYQGYDASVNPFRHTRNILFVKPYFWIVSDYVSGGAGEHNYSQNWHFLPGANISLKENVLTTDFDEGADLRLINVRPDSSGKIVRGYYSGTEQSTEYANYARFEQMTTGDAVYDTVLFPVKKGSDDTCTAEENEILVQSGAATSFTLSLHIGGRDSTAVYYNSNETQPAEREIGGGYGFDGRQAYVEKYADGSLAAVNISRGARLTDGGRNIVHMRGGTAIDNLSAVYSPGAVEIFSDGIAADELARLAVYAPDAAEVRLNGEPVVWYKNGSYVVFAKDYYILDAADGSAVTEEEITTEGSFAADGKTYTASLTFAAGTTLSADGWDGTVPAPIAASKTADPDGAFAAQIGYSAAVKFDKPPVLTLPDTGLSAGYVRGGKVYPLATDKYIEVTSSGGRISVSFKDSLFDIILYKKKSDTGGGSSSGSSGGGSGGSSSGGSSGTVIPAVTPEPAASPDVPQFSDISEHWAREYIEKAAALSIAAGYGGEFLPDRTLTRAEAAAFLVRLGKIPQTEYGGDFADVGADSWYTGAVAAAVYAGIASGSGGYFRPDDEITREELCVMLAHLAKFSDIALDMSDALAGFSDGAEVSVWARSDMNAMINAGVISGNGGKIADPRGGATRAMMCTVICKFLQLMQ